MNKVTLITKMNSLPYLMIFSGALIIASNHVLARYLDGAIPPMGFILAHGAIFLLPFTVYGLLKNRVFILKLEIIFTDGCLICTIG